MSLFCVHLLKNNKSKREKTREDEKRKQMKRRGGGEERGKNSLLMANHPTLFTQAIPDIITVTQVPHFRLFKGGKLLFEFSGANRDMLQESIQKYLF